MKHQYVVGVDLGGTKIIAALADNGRILAEVTGDTLGGAGGDLVNCLASVIDEVISQALVSPGDVLATAVGGAGVPQLSGALTLAPNLGIRNDVSVARELGERLGHLVLLENDANAAAIGELTVNAKRDFVFIAIGTGIGMGIVSGGALLRGTRNAAGEIAFLPFGSNPLDAANHVHGALEEVVSGAGIEKSFRAMTGQTARSIDIFASSAAGTDAAEEVVDKAAFEAARAIGSVIAILDPSEVILGGGIGSRQDFRDRIAVWLAKLGYPEIPVVISELGERASLVGAIALATQHVAVERAIEGTAG